MKDIIVTIRIFKNESCDSFFNRFNKIYLKGFKSYRFNISKMIGYLSLSAISSIINDLKFKYNDLKIYIDLGYPNELFRIDNIIMSGKELTNIELKEGSNVRICSNLSENNDKNEIFFYIPDSKNIPDSEGYYADGLSRIKLYSKNGNKYIHFYDYTNVHVKSALRINFLKKVLLTIEIIEFINSVNCDGVLLSFVESPEEVLNFKKVIGDNIEVYVKIESQKGLENLERLLVCSEGLILARGDLAFNINLNEMMSIHDYCIKIATNNNKKIYVATDILSSIENRKFPSRSDIMDLCYIYSSAATGLILNGSIFLNDKEHIVYDIISKFRG